jgi:orotidine-5'-phosphate decarboxylase
VSVERERLLVRLPGRSAEEAARAAQAAPGVGGYAVGPDLLAGPGAAAVGALSRIGSVAVLWAAHGDAGDVAAVCDGLAGYGARWVAVHASAGREAMAAGVAALAPTDTEVVAWTLDGGLDDSRVVGLGLGRSRGRVVSRLAAAAGEAGVTAIACTISDLGVVAQVAPGMTRIAIGATEPGDAGEALERGADLVVVSVDVVSGT